jgi:hypothetical protein
MKKTANFEVVTPKMAEEWLTKFNTHNRAKYPITIDKYAREISAGAWTGTNQGIGFADDGTLLDGQQRLSAIVLSKVPVELLVVRGLPRIFQDHDGHDVDTQDVIDGNKPRTPADVLLLSHGVENANVKMAIANMLVYAIKGTPVKLSPRIGLKIIELYSDEIEFTLSGRSQTKGLSYTPTITGIIMAAKVDLDKSMFFKDQYFKGTDLKSGSPALTLRNFMLSRTKTGGQGSGVRTTILNYSLTALKMFFNDKPLKRLIASDQAKEYFLSKQKSCVSMIMEWLG